MEEAHSNSPEISQGSTPEPAAPPATAPALSAPRQRNRWWHEWGKPLLIILLAVGSFRSAVADWNDVPTGSMIPTILEGDRIFVNKVAYSLRFPFTRWHIVRWGQPQRGDIVVFLSPEDGKRLVKRVIGIPGDRVELHNNQLLINGTPVHYSLFESNDEELREIQNRNGAHFRVEELEGHVHPITILNFRPWDPRASNFPIDSIPRGQFFMMGDNRNNSHDSRYFGPVGIDNILGRATAVAFSLNRNSGYSPRWNRLFTKLP